MSNIRDWADFSCPDCGCDVIHVTNTKALKPLVVECLICEASMRSLQESKRLQEKHS